MRPAAALLLSAPLLLGLAVQEEEEGGQARVFPLLPPYQGVDFAANFNKLKSSGDTAYFVVRDSIVVSIKIVRLVHLTLYEFIL